MTAITPQTVLDALAWHVGELYGVSAKTLAREVTGGDDSDAAQRSTETVCARPPRA